MGGQLYLARLTKSLAPSPTLDAPGFGPAIGQSFQEERTRGTFDMYGVFCGLID